MAQKEDLHPTTSPTQSPKGSLSFTALTTEPDSRLQAGEVPVLDGEAARVTAMRTLLHQLSGATMEAIPEAIEDPNDLESIFDFIRKGGRLPGVDYNNLKPVEKERGLKAARAFLNKPMFSVVNGVALDGKDEFDKRTYFHPNPNDQEEKFGTIHALHPEKVDHVMSIVDNGKRTKIPDWDGEHNLGKRIEVLDRAMALIYKDKNVLAGLLALSGGKSGLEGFRDMQELFDFANNYRGVPKQIALQQLVLKSDGDTSLGVRELDKVVGLWQPFNFPCIGAGDLIAALMMGNTVVIHTSARMVGPYLWFFEKFREAGVPAPRVHFVIPHGDSEGGKIDSTMSENLAKSDVIGNIYFTGSRAVASKLQQTQAEKNNRLGRLDLKLHAEAGGYNPMLIVGLPERALQELEAFRPSCCFEISSCPQGSWLREFAEAIIDSSCGLQGHKCSALGRVTVAIDDSGVNGLTTKQAWKLQQFALAALESVQAGDVTRDPKVKMSGLIDMAMRNKIIEALSRIIKAGGKTHGRFSLEEISRRIPGSRMLPIMFEAPAGMEVEEIFGPVFEWKQVDGRNLAIQDTQRLPYALTCAVYAKTAEEALAIREQLPNGVGYISSETCAPTTTAAPAPQIPFGGKKASGTDSGVLKPGTANHPLQFADVYAKAIPRNEWGKGLGDPNRTLAAFEAFLTLQGIRLKLRERVIAAGEIEEG